MSYLQDQKCSRPHDKVYGILGLTCERGWRLGDYLTGLLVKPDYNKPINDVYRDATRASICYSGSCRALAFVEHRPDYKPGGRRSPSWSIPVYDQYSDLLRPPKLLVGLASDSALRPLESLRQTVSPKNAENLNHLKCYGVSLEPIAQCSSWLSENLDFDSMRPQFLRETVSIAEQNGKTIGDLVSVLTAGNMPDDPEPIISLITNMIHTRDQDEQALSHQLLKIQSQLSENGRRVPYYRF